MATIKERRAKDGALSYVITVAGGMDCSGKQIRHYRTWKPVQGATKRQIEKGLSRAVSDFEREIEQGFQLDNRQKFADYAEYVLAIREESGTKPRTIDRYRGLLVRINEAIGHIKLLDIRPQHLNSLYQNLREEGIRRSGTSARVKIDLSAWLKERKISRAEISRRSDVSATTISTATCGKTISAEKAESIAKAMDIDVEAVFEITKNNAPLSSKTVLEHHRLISTILDQAEKEMLIPYNPAKKVRPPKVEYKEAVCYRQEEMDAIITALDEHAPLKWRTLVYLLIDTGCRRGEGCGLKWEDVDHHAGIITIRRSLNYGGSKRGIYEGSTKTGSIRSIKLSPEVLDLLEQHRKEQFKLRFANGDRWQNTGYVFTRDNGQCINPDTITSWLHDFAKRYNLPPLHPHAFRHTAASSMIAAGVDIVTTSRTLGHANPTTTANIYAHQIQEANAKAEEARSAVFARRRTAMKKQA